MIDLETVVKVIAPVVQTVAIGVTAYYASRGLRAWREQLVGKRRMEVAEAALLSTYKARDALNYVRNPGSFGGEGSTRERASGESVELASQLDAYFVPLERIQKVSGDFAEFQKSQQVCEVHFGLETGKPFKAIMAARWEVIIAARMLMDTEKTYSRGIGDPDRHEDWKATIWAGIGGGSPDRIDRIVATAVAEIEEMCRPHIGPVSGKGRWQLQTKR